jgi:hypothetical protein
MVADKIYDGFVLGIMVKCSKTSPFVAIRSLDLLIYVKIEKTLAAVVEIYHQGGSMAKGAWLRVNGKEDVCNESFRAQSQLWQLFADVEHCWRLLVEQSRSISEA